MSHPNLTALHTIARREIVRILRIWTQTLVPPAIANKVGKTLVTAPRRVAVRSAELAARRLVARASAAVCPSAAFAQARA